MKINLIRQCLTKTTQLKNTTLKRPNQLMYLLGFSTVPLIFLILVLCLIFKQVVQILLFLYHGRKFKGFLSSPDMYWAHEKVGCRSTVVFMLFVKCNKEINVFEKLRQRLQEKVFDRPQDYPKLTSTKHKFLGYTYLLPNTSTVDDVVKILKINDEKHTITEEEYKEIVTEYAFRPWPKDNTGLWDVHVCQKRLVVGEENDGCLYPILFRIHHLVADGASIVAFVGKVLSDEIPDFALDKLGGTQNIADDDKVKKSVFAIYSHALVRIAQNIYHFLNLVYVWMGTAYWLQHIREKDFNALHGPKLTDEKIATWYRENEVELIPLIKKIKNAVPKAAFSDVVYTALSASFTAYFKKKSQPIPETFTIGNAMVYSLRNLSDNGPAILENNTCFVFLTIPTQTASLYDTLLKVGELNAELKKGPDIEITLWSLRWLLGIFPEPLLAMFSFMGGVTTNLSNLPGTGISTTLCGHEASNILFFALNRSRTGVACSLLSYDNRLHMGLMVDKVLINKREEADAILQDFIKNLHLLNEEVEYTNSTKKVKEEEGCSIFITRF